MHEGVPTRWWFIGASGSGKSTYARAVANALSIDAVELDSIFHQENWTPLETGEFRRRVLDVVAGESWTLDGNYRAVRDVVMQRVQVIVELDFPRPRVTAQIARRTLWRAIRRVELWNGNRESLRNVVRWDPQYSVIRWSWTTHAKIRERFTWMETLAQVYGVQVIRASSHADLRVKLAHALGIEPDAFVV